jgi:hypothetical protein
MLWNLIINKRRLRCLDKEEDSVREAEGKVLAAAAAAWEEEVWGPAANVFARIAELAFPIKSAPPVSRLRVPSVGQK